MRIAVVTPFVDKQHGTERVLAELLQRLAAEHGAEIHLYAQRVADLPVCTASYSAGETQPGGKIVWHKVSAIGGPHLLQYVWWYFANRLARRRNELVELTYSPGINAPNVDAITVHIVFRAFYEQVRPQLRLLANSPLRWPLLLHRILYYKLIMALERRIYADRRIALSAVSKAVARQLARYFGREDVEVIRNAVDARQFNAADRLARRESMRARFGVKPCEFVLLLIGNDWKKKGLDTLLEALAVCSDLPARLLVVGQDSREPYETQVDKLKLQDKVNFLAPSQDVMQFYAAADAYVGPSLEDAYGLPTLESMACGLPVIASSAAGVSEIIADGENGLLLRDPRDAMALSSLIRKIHESPEWAAALGYAAERKAASESWEAHAERTYKHFERVLARKKSGAER